MTDETQPSPPRLEIDWVKTVAGALAAVSSAVLLSRVGAAGTIIGAAIGSVVVTVASAFYTQGLQRSRARLAEAHALAAQRVGAAQAEVRRAERRQVEVGVADPAARSQVRHAEEHLHDAERDLDRVAAQDPAIGVPARQDVSWSERLAALPWRRIALAAGLLFVGVVVAITAFELLAGRSVSSITGGTDRTGGTSITQLGTDVRGRTETPTPGPGEPAAPSETPSDAPTDGASDAPSEAPSDAPDDAPSDAPVPSEDASPAPTTDPTMPADPTAPAAPESALP